MDGWPNGSMGDSFYLEVCRASKRLVHLWEKGRVLLSVSGVPHKQAFQRRVLSHVAWTNPPRFRIWVRGTIVPLWGLRFQPLTGCA